MRWTIPILVLVLHAGLRAEPSGRSVKELRAFYAANCAKCHGPDGSGRAADGKRLGGMDFTDAEQMAKHSDARMVKAIRKGIFFGVVMHPFKERITEPEALLLVQEVLRKAQKGKVISGTE
jgi:mono/diheme cytochrome c family protein